MAVAFVQAASNGGNPATTTAIAAITVTAGNLLVVTVRASPASGAGTLTVSDDQGNTYTQDLNPSFASGNITAQYSAPNCAGASTIVTFSITGTGRRIGIAVHEYSGAATSTPLDQTNSNAGTGTTATSGSVTTTVADEALVAAIGVASTPTWEADYPSRTSDSTGRLYTGSRVVSATLTDEASATFGGSVAWDMLIATYKGTVAGGAATYPGYIGGGWW